MYLLLGFCGAPFTIASYLIEGGPTKSYNKTRGMLISEPEIWNRLMGKLADMSIEYLSMQARAGANALQIFDSWVGAVNSSEYEQAIFPHMERIISTVKSRFPNLPLAMNGVVWIILFLRGLNYRLTSLLWIGVVPLGPQQIEGLHKPYRGTLIQLTYMQIQRQWPRW